MDWEVVLIGVGIAAIPLSLLVLWYLPRFVRSLRDFS